MEDIVDVGLPVGVGCLCFEFVVGPLPDTAVGALVMKRKYMVLGKDFF